MSKVLHLNAANFEAEAGRPGVLVLDFTAGWCGPCRMFAPILEQLAAEAGDNVRVGKIDIEESPALAARFQVQNIPAVFILKNGQIASQMVGVQSKAKLLDLVKGL